MSDNSRQSQPASPSLQPSAPPAAILDAEVLAEIRQLAGEDAPTFLASAIDIYLEDAAKILDTIRGAIAQQQPETILIAAHSLKSMSGSLGATEFSHLCQRLETLAKSGMSSAVIALAQQLEVDHEAVRVALDIERLKVLESM